MRNPVAIWMPGVLVVYGFGFMAAERFDHVAFCALAAALALCVLGVRWDRPRVTPARGPFRLSPTGRDMADVPDYEWLSAGIEAELRGPIVPDYSDTGWNRHPQTPRRRQMVVSQIAGHDGEMHDVISYRYAPPPPPPGIPF